MNIKGEKVHVGIPSSTFSLILKTQVKERPIPTYLEIRRIEVERLALTKIILSLRQSGFTSH